MKRIFAIWAALLCGLYLFAADPLDSGLAGYYAVRLDGKAVASHNENTPMIPASNVKLITTGSALRSLGKNFRFETKIGYSGELRDSILVGDLYIIGGGDPSIAAENRAGSPMNTTFQAWKEILTKAGIKRVLGNVVGDPRWFDGQNAPLSWEREDLGCDYGAVSVGLSFFENIQKIYVSAAQENATSLKIVFPETPWMTFTNYCTIAPPESDEEPILLNTNLAPLAEMRGFLPARKKGMTVYCSNRFGAYTCAYYFYKYLLENGVMVTGKWADIGPLGNIRTDLNRPYEGTAACLFPKVLGGVKSPTLLEMIKDCNRDSDNYYAECFLRAMGKTLKGTADYDFCLAARYDVLRSLGLDVKRCLLADGSGLSRKNSASARFFVDYLCAMANSPQYKDFLHALPQPGEGTLKNRFISEKGSWKSRIYMKSGSMSGVRCFSGYILSEDGKKEHTVVFSVLCNNMLADDSEVLSAIEEKIKSFVPEAGLEPARL